MQEELITPAEAEVYVLIASVLLTIVGAGWGWKALGTRGLLAALTGPLVWLLWQGHKFVTRYDPQTGYFGLDKVAVLLLEVLLFVGIGAFVGMVLREAMSRKNRESS